MTTGDGLPEQRRWTWEHPVGPHWLLHGDVGSFGLAGWSASWCPEPLRRASRRGLLDVTVENNTGEPLPTGILDILEHWRVGGPSQKNLWAGFAARDTEIALE